MYLCIKLVSPPKKTDVHHRNGICSHFTKLSALVKFYIIFCFQSVESNKILTLSLLKFVLDFVKGIFFFSVDTIEYKMKTLIFTATALQNYNIEFYLVKTSMKYYFIITSSCSSTY